ncbi:MAG TPA: hypothetical protein VFX13_00975 [Gaiellales bacterium]|nr:hypothetical protein [Gaiellales bacterium]
MAADTVRVVDPKGEDDYPAGAALREAAFVRYEGVRSSLESSHQKLIAVLALNGGLVYVLFQMGTGLPHRDGLRPLWTAAVVAAVLAVGATLHGLRPVQLDGIGNKEFFGHENASEPAGLVELHIAQSYIDAADKALPQAMHEVSRRFTIAEWATGFAAIATAAVSIVQVWTG